MTGEECNYPLYEITIEADQKCIKTKLKLADISEYENAEDIKKDLKADLKLAAESYNELRENVKVLKFRVAPLEGQ